MSLQSSRKLKTPEQEALEKQRREARVLQLRESQSVWDDASFEPHPAPAPRRVIWSESRVRDFDSEDAPAHFRTSGERFELPSSPQSDGYSTTSWLLHSIERNFRSESIASGGSLSGSRTREIIVSKLAEAVAQYPYAHRTPFELLRMAGDELKGTLATFAPFLTKNAHQAREARAHKMLIAQCSLCDTSAPDFDPYNYGDYLDAVYTRAPSVGTLLRGCGTRTWPYNQETRARLKFIHTHISFLLTRPRQLATGAPFHYYSPYYYYYYYSRYEKQNSG